MNMEQQSQGVTYQPEFDFTTLAEWARPRGCGEGAIPTAAPTREQQVFAAWKVAITGRECELFWRVKHEIQMEEFAGLGKGLGFWVKKRTKQRVAVPLSKASTKKNVY